jgi:hypothetical protein
MSFAAEGTVVEAIATLRERGYGADFDVAPGGLIVCRACGDVHKPEDAVVEATFRFEGASDPDDEAVVFGLACRACGARGVLVAAYGPAASADEAAVVTALARHHQTKEAGSG